MSPKNLTLSIVSFTILTTNIALADWKADAKAIKVSGGDPLSIRFSGAANREGRTR